MDRKIVIDLIVKNYRSYGTDAQETLVVESLRRMGDMNLFAFATEMGIDLTAVHA